MKSIYLVVILIISLNVYPKGTSKDDEKSKEIKELKSQIEDLEKRVIYQNDQINSQAGMLDTAFDGVSAELSASSNYISVFGVIIGLLTIGIGLYVTKMEKSIRRMSEDSELLMQRNIQIKKDVEDLGNQIVRDSKGLYEVIRNEESNHLMNRLISVPEDISNLFYTIASRDLEEHHFAQFKEAYTQVKHDSKYNEDYLTLLFQHFSGKSLLDPDIKSAFIKSLPNSFMNSFKSDVIKASTDFFLAVKNLDVSKWKKEINEFVKGLDTTNYSNYDEIYFAIVSTINDREQQFRIYNIIDNIPATLTFRKKYGTLLIEFHYEELSEREEKTIEEINKII